MTDDLEREAYQPIVETERAADFWLALALRKLARDDHLVGDVYARINDARGTGRDLVRDVLRAVADHLEGA